MCCKKIITNSKTKKIYLNIEKSFILDIVLRTKSMHWTYTIKAMTTLYQNDWWGI